jgi:hypothetical protein
MGSPGRVKALWVGAVVALSLHGLVLSFLQWRDLRHKDSERLQSRDNTQELLQFSSQATQTRLGKDAAIPSTPQLPPPKPRHSAALSASTREPGQSRTGRVPRGQPSGPSAIAPAELEGRDGPRFIMAGSQRPAASGDRRENAKTAKSSRYFQSVISSDWRTAIERLRTVDRQDLASREVQKAGPSSLGMASLVSAEEKGVIRLDENSTLGLAYRELWREATPQTILPINVSGGSNFPVEVRRVSWRNVRAAELPIRHGQLLIVADKTLLLWMQDDYLYLLQDSPSAQSSG